jgi:hypothetical protein
MNLKQRQMHKISQNTNWEELREKVSEGDGILYSRMKKKDHFLYVDMIIRDGIFLGVVENSCYYVAFIKNKLFQKLIDQQKDIEEKIIKKSSAKIGINYKRDSLIIKGYFTAQGALLSK